MDMNGLMICVCVAIWRLLIVLGYTGDQLKRIILNVYVRFVSASLLHYSRSEMIVLFAQ